MTFLPSPASAPSTPKTTRTSALRRRQSCRNRFRTSSIFAWPLGAAGLLLLAINTLFWSALLFPVALLKLALPTRAVRRRLDFVLNGIARAWITCNDGWIRMTQQQRWDVQGTSALRYDDWYLVNCNHRSWVDIFVLQRVLNGRIPLLKFFLKQQLIYVPVIGLAWWALDFPFMKRHGKTALRRNPALRQQDRETTRRACEKFSLVPTSVMVFAEGTRFTEAKHRTQASPYRHLLKPKAGALAFAIDAMGEKFGSLIDVTIVYPDGAPSFWQLACGRTGRVAVRVQERRISATFCQGDYGGDAAFRREFHRWLAGQWEEKDLLIEGILKDTAR